MKRKFPFIVGNIYHVFNRGVAKCAICDGEADYWRFMQGLCLFNNIESAGSILWRLERDRGRLTMNVLKEYVAGGKNREPLVRVMAYCVMGNHFHLLAEEIKKDGITQFMQKFGVGYVRYFNNKHDRVGGLFQDKFKNILVDNEDYLQYLLVYINVLNPAEFVASNWKAEGIKNIEKVLEFAEEYKWSSHLDFLDKRGSLILDKGILSKLVPTPKAYMNLVKMVLKGKKYEQIRHLILEN